MDVNEITRIVELMSKHDLTEISIKSEELALTIKRERRQPSEPAMMAPMMHAPQMMMMPQMQGGQPAPAAPAAAPAAPKAEDAIPGRFIESPLVGTFYGSPAPDAAAYVKIGDRVEEGTTVCIIEAMKVMNEIKAEKSGTIAAMLVENGQPVEFGQPLYRLS
jgi:acetyl-CoA carboxylase biotin carboxyl carrier protein